MGGGGWFWRVRRVRLRWADHVGRGRRASLLFALGILDAFFGGGRRTVPVSDGLATGHREGGSGRQEGDENMPGEGRFGRHVCLGCVVLLTSALVCACACVYGLSRRWFRLEGTGPFVCARGWYTCKSLGSLLGRLLSYVVAHRPWITSGLGLGTDCVEV